MANTGCAGSAMAVAPICLNFGITAPVLSCVITWRGRIETKSPARTTVPGGSPSACRAAIFSTSVRPIVSPYQNTCPSLRVQRINRSPSGSVEFDWQLRLHLLGRTLAQKLRDIKVHKIGVMEDDRFDRAFDLVAFMAVGGDNVHH